MQNSQSSRFKQSKMELLMNRIILYVLLVQLLFCIIVASVGAAWYENNQDDHSYLDVRNSTAKSAVISFFSYFLLLNTLIPISLIVTLEVIKIVQAYFVVNDSEMYSEERRRLAKVSTTSINEELGQINYIFSDKTGTLTRNVMEFKLFSVGTEVYGETDAMLPEKEEPLDPPLRPSANLKGLLEGVEDHAVDVSMRSQNNT